MAELLHEGRGKLPGCFVLDIDDRLSVLTFHLHDTLSADHDRLYSLAQVIEERRPEMIGIYADDTIRGFILGYKLLAMKHWLGGVIVALVSGDKCYDRKSCSQRHVVMGIMGVIGLAGGSGHDDYSVLVVLFPK